MSLQVWLPLAKDLRNQGLDNVTITNNGATFDSAGKLGGCYSFDGSDDYISLNSSAINSCFTGGFQSFSAAMWVYRADATRAILFGDYLLSGAINFNIELTTSNYLRFYWNGAPDWGAGTITANAWTHICYTYDGSALKIYTNGILASTNTITLTSKNKNSGDWYLGRDSRTGTTAFNGKLNDFRIYDHCLSPMEVKELSKGLVLHYPLNRQGWGQENLYTGSKDFSGSWTNSGSWTTSSEVYQGFTVKQKSSVWGGIVQNIPCTTGDIFTISFFAKVQSGGNILSIHRSSLGNVTTGLTILGGNFSSGTTWITATEDGTQWKRYWATVRIDSSDITYLQWRIENSIAEKTLYICGMKMEKGSIVTPWCPNSSDTLATTMGLNSTTEYDCSGFCNNGTRTGTFTWTSDTPKYSVSTYFDGNSYILTDSGSFAWFDFNQCTIAAWFNPTLKPSGYSGSIGIAHNQGASYKYFAISNYGGVFVANSINGSSYINTSSNYTLPLNEWHHCVATLDGTTVKVYVDGELKNTSTISWGNSGIATDTRVNIGTDLPGTDEMYTGYYSDARIYTTALSADDILELYQQNHL